jgi:predicted phage tail protein
MVKVELHGILGEKIKKNKWSLSINSVGEAIRAIETNTKILYETLYELEKDDLKYRVLINGKDFKIFKNPEEIENDFDKIINSNLTISYKDEDLKSIDIIPVIEGEGGGGFFGAIFGVALVVVGIVLVFVPGGQLFGAALILAGIGLAAAGFMALLSSPPPFQAPEFSSPQIAAKGGGGKSYLFDGPTNTRGEGGPIPIGYGRLTVGSKTISATFNTAYVANTSARTT